MEPQAENRTKNTVLRHAASFLQARWEQIEWSVILAGGVALAVLLRSWLIEFESPDFQGHLYHWYQFIRQQGGYTASLHELSNYAPPYLYMLTVIYTLAPEVANVVAVKLPSICFDFLCAWYGYQLVRLKCPTGYYPLFAAFAVLFSPTVVLNSAFWGQADMIYTCGLVACLYYIVTQRPRAAFIAYGLALSVKIQAIFMAPFLGILLVKRVVSWQVFALIPLMYVLTVIPSWLAGRSFGLTLWTYQEQAQSWRYLNSGLPNFWQWIPQQMNGTDIYALMYPAGMIWTFVLAAILLIAVSKSQLRLTLETTIHLAFLIVLSVPFFLPKMHDRYFFAADVISLLYAFIRPRYFYCALLINLASLVAYMPFLAQYIVIPLPYVALLPLAVIVVLAHSLVHDRCEQRGEGDGSGC